jgi:hypothetical protein
MGRKNPPNGHTPCPTCDMGMIVVDGYGQDPERQTFECLRCGHIDRPGEKAPRKLAAE